VDLGEKHVVTAMSLLMRVDIVSYGDGSMIGELSGRYIEKPYVFSDLVNMIHKMEEIFDTHGFPQAFLSPRSFKDGKNERKKQVTELGTSADQAKPADTEGMKCTFEITVRFRQNATWQGHILWVEKGVSQDFRSVLEMLKLIDEALSEGREKTLEWGN